MPIYAYKCESCGLAKDVLQKMSDDVLTVCPACNQATFQKQVTAAGFQLKGSGWYVTDFRGGNTAAPAEGKGDGKADTGSDAKSDGKADGKSDGKAVDSGASKSADGAAAGSSGSPAPVASPASSASTSSSSASPAAGA
jgi:putative FmdB family regulatory protein